MLDPVPFAVVSLEATYESHPNARKILPAMGYGEAQARELEVTINAAETDV